MNKISVAIVDDNPTDLVVLTGVINKLPGFKLIFTANNGKDLIFKLTEKQPEIILLDLQMPFMGGLDVLANFENTNNCFSFIICSNHVSTNDLLKAKELGVKGFCYKNKKSVLNALNCIIKDSVYFERPNDRIDILNNNIVPNKFNAEEVEIINLLAIGHTNQEIAEALSFTILKVNNTLLNLLERLNLQNTNHLIAYAFAHGYFYKFDAFNTPASAKPPRSLQKAVK